MSRHEIGHYYQNVLVRGDAEWEECRTLFGDERASYRDAIARHYKFGAPDGWRESFISEYATMHPWEDFAECFAHYLHITGTLQTAAAAGVVTGGIWVGHDLPRLLLSEPSVTTAPRSHRPAVVTSSCT